MTPLRVLCWFGRHDYRYVDSNQSWHFPDDRVIRFFAYRCSRCGVWQRQAAFSGFDYGYKHDIAFMDSKEEVDNGKSEV